MCALLTKLMKTFSYCIISTLDPGWWRFREEGAGTTRGITVVRSLGRLSGRRVCQLNSCNSEWKCTGGASGWDRLCLHQLWSHPACSPPPRPPQPSASAGACNCSDSSGTSKWCLLWPHGQERPEGWGLSGRGLSDGLQLARGSQTSVSSCSSAKAENLGRQACSKRLQRWGLTTFLFLFLA